MAKTPYTLDLATYPGKRGDGNHCSATELTMLINI